MSAKSPLQWNAEAFPFLAPDKWKSYGKVYRMAMAGHLAAPTAWTDGPTTIEIVVHEAEIAICQDGNRLVAIPITGPLAEQLGHVRTLRNVQWGQGVYGRFGGVSLSGSMNGQ